MICERGVVVVVCGCSYRGASGQAIGAHNQRDSAIVSCERPWVGGVG